MKVYLANRKPLTLGKILGQGGEGSVFALDEVEQQHVVKIYHQLPSQNKQAKLQAMMADDLAVLSKVALWPTALVYNQQQQIIGFVMPRLPEGSVAIHHLYNPSQRKQDFPKADYAFLVNTARNLAAAFVYWHSCGHCMGDVNQNNVMVAPDSTITLIDCDSFQITHQGQTFGCDVGVAHFTPPELHGQLFAEVIKTPAHDNFGLAILIFHLLMMGRHPFAGVYLGDGEMPIEKAIKEFRYAYSKNAQAKQMQPPPKAPLITCLSDDIQELFELAFDENINKRPTAQQWLDVLQTFQSKLKVCQHVKEHRYYQDLDKCPWCEFASVYDVELFSSGLSIKTSNKQEYKPLIDIEEKIKDKVKLINDIKINQELPQYSLDDYSDNASNRFLKIIFWFLVSFLIYANIGFLSIDIFLVLSFVFLIFIVGFDVDKYLPDVSIKKLAISRSFWLLYVFFIMLFDHSNVFLLAGIFWFFVKYFLIYIKVEKNINWPIEMWLTDYKFYQVKNDFWLLIGKINDVENRWHKHIEVGQALLERKKQALLLAEEYSRLLNNLDMPTDKVKDLACSIPDIYEVLIKEYEDYSYKNRKLLNAWNTLNQEKIELESLYSYNKVTLLPLVPNENWVYKKINITSFIFMPIIVLILINIDVLRESIKINDENLNLKQSYNKKEVPKIDNKEINHKKNLEQKISKDHTKTNDIVAGRVLHAIGLYQLPYTGTENVSNEVKVIIQNTKNTKDMVLLLVSYESVKWNIVSKTGVNIKKIIVSSYSQPSTVTGIQGIPIEIRNHKSPSQHNEVLVFAKSIKEEVGASDVMSQGGYKGVELQVY